MSKRSWSKNQLIGAVSSSSSYRQVINKLGLKEAGGNYDQIKKYIKEYRLNIKHFKGKAWNKGLKGIGKFRVPLKNILVQESDYQSFKLKKRLFAAKLKEQKCEECGWAKFTSDGYLPLELDHINGNHHDNRIENLRVLCPNCHSLKSTYRGRKNKKIKNARVL
ncbi:MAG: HNH endonuclease [Patescibacteria group bacterium]|nr:HNH endonuclease [Patescibacteria group bacterium]